MWDHIDHTDFYLEQGYVVFEMGKEGTNNEFNYLYRRKGVSQSSAGNDMSGGSGSESSMGNGSSSESTMGGSNNMSSGGSENRENSFGQHNTGSGYGGGHSGFSSQ